MNILSSLNPKFLISIYSSAPPKDEIYAEIFRVKNGMLLTGQPLTKESLNKIIKICKPEKEIMPSLLGPIPNNLIYFDYNGANLLTIWWTKERKREMTFKKELKMPKGIAWQPPMLWVANGESLYVYFLKKNNKPNMKSIICEPVFPNVSADGLLCNGTMPIGQILKEKKIERIMSRWEDMFYRSEFSHKTHLKLWKELIETKKKFPQNQLKPLYTFQKLMNEHTQD